MAKLRAAKSFLCQFHPNSFRPCNAILIPGTLETNGTVNWNVCLYYSGMTTTTPWEKIYNIGTLSNFLYVWWWPWDDTVHKIAANASGKLPQGPVVIPGHSLESQMTVRSSLLARSYTQIRKTHTHTQTRLLRSGSRLVHQPVSLYPPLCSWWCVWIRTEALELITRTATTLTTTMMMTMKIPQLGVQTLDRYPSQIATSVVCDFCADP